MPFEFIDNSLIDRCARKKIRSHVMKDKNSGKTRPAKKTLSRTEVKPTVRVFAPRIEVDVQNSLPSPSPQVANELSIFPFPADLTSRSRVLVYKCKAYRSLPYSSIAENELVILDMGKAVNEPKLCCQSVDVSTSIWIRYIFLDDAYFHSAVATSIIYNDWHPLTCEDATESLRHLLRATHLINERLSGKKALSDTTIATIVGLIQYERLRDQHHDATIHFTGLQRIIALRGGVAYLMSNPHLADKIFKVDIELALYYGTVTHFQVEDVPNDILSQLRSTFKHDEEHQMWNFQLVTRLSPNLQDVLSDILTLVCLLNYHNKILIPLNAYSFQEAVVLVSYCLVRISPLAGPRPTTDLEDVLHVALTAFTTTLFLGFGSATSKAPLLLSLLRETAQRYLPDTTESQKLLLWVLFMGRESVFTDLDECWLIPKITMTILALGLNTWTDVRYVLSQFPWINLIHDQLSRALWEKSVTYCRPPTEH